MPRKLRVLHMIDHLELGGAQTVLVNYAYFLDKKGFKTDICALYGENAYASRLRNHKVFILSPVRYNAIKIVWGVYRLLKTGRYDIVHLHLYYSKFLGRVVTKLFFSGRIKVVVHEHNTIDFEFSKYFFYPIIRWFERYLYRTTDMVLCNSEYVNRFYTRVLGYDKSNCKVMLNGIDCANLDSKSDEPSKEVKGRFIRKEGGLVFGFLSRLHYAKGVDYLIEAFAGFVNADPDNRKHVLLVAGFGPEKNKLERLVRKLNIQENIFFIGKIKADKKFFYEYIDCFVLPSIYESFGITLLEALYYKTPVVAREIGGIPEVLGKGRYGVLFKNGGIEELQEKISFIANLNKNSKAEVDRMCERGHKYVRDNFNISIMVEQLSEIYTDICKKFEGVSIVHLIDHLRIGGSQKQLMMIIRGLAGKDVKQRVMYLTDISPRTHDELDHIGVTVESIGKRYTQFPMGLWRMLRGMSRDRPDVVHTMLFYSDMVGRVLGRMSGCKHIISNMRARNRDKNFFKRFLSKATSGLVDHFIANAQNFVDYVQKNEMAKDKDVRVIPNGIVFDEEPFDKAFFRQKICQEYNINGNDLILTTGGRLVEQKGYGILLEAYKSLHAKYDNISLLIMGKGPDEVALKKFTEDNDIESKVVFAGELEDVSDVLKGSDLFVSSSLFEGMPNIVMEAMSYGLPVVATRVDGNLELIEDDINGVLVNPADSDALYSGLDLMLKSRDKWALYSENNKNKIRTKYSEKLMVEAYYDFFETMSKK